jgi:hypothetical protein
MSNLQSRTASAQDRNQRRHFDPGNPVPARIAEMERAVLAGEIAAEYVVITRVILCLLLPDRDRNWRTIKPVTYAGIAKLHGCKERTVRTAFARLRQRFPWFNWRKVEGGIAFKMRQDGCMIGKRSGKLVAHSDARASNPKESPRRRSISRKFPSNSSSYGERRETQGNPAADVAGPSVDAPSVAERLAAELPEAITYGVSLGLTRREVLARADKYVKHYTAHPERTPLDFCGHIWLQRDAFRKAQASAKRAQTGVIAALNDLPDQHEDDGDQGFDPHDPDGDYARYDAYLERRAASDDPPSFDDFHDDDPDDAEAWLWRAVGASGEEFVR